MTNSLSHINPGLFSSESSEWETPQDFFDELDAEFGFTLDPCSTHENAKCKRHFTKAEDGLRRRWSGVVFMNPPYGREIIAWVRKAAMEALCGATAVCLLPARTDTAWFHDYILGNAEIRFVRGRLKFGGAKWNAPFPSMVAVFQGRFCGPCFCGGKLAGRVWINETR